MRTEYECDDARPDDCGVLSPGSSVLVPRERSALFVMAKDPQAGLVKTRLCPPLDHETAARLYRCFLLDVLDLAGAVPEVDPVIAYAPPEARPAFARLVDGRFQLLPQEGQDLGARLANAFRALFASGYARVTALSTDSPDLPPDVLRSAFRRLEEAPVVVGPCPDGGYYLIGLSRFVPDLFCDMPWSTDRVVPVTAERAAGLGLEVAWLPPWHDVDTPEDLHRLCGDLLREAGRSGCARRTAAFCQEALHGFASLRR